MKHGLSLLSPFSRNAQQTSVNTALRCSGLFFFMFFFVLLLLVSTCVRCNVGTFNRVIDRNGLRRGLGGCGSNTDTCPTIIVLQFWYKLPKYVGHIYLPMATALTVTVIWDKVALTMEDDPVPRNKEYFHFIFAGQVDVILTLQKKVANDGRKRSRDQCSRLFR